MSILDVGTEVYAGRPPYFSCSVERKYLGVIEQVLPAARRVPLRYLVKFLLPDPTTGDTDSVVVPFKRRDRVCVVKAPTSTSTTTPTSTPSVPATVIDVDDRELLTTVAMCASNSDEDEESIVSIPEDINIINDDESVPNNESSAAAHDSVEGNESVPLIAPVVVPTTTPVRATRHNTRQRSNTPAFGLTDNALIMRKIKQKGVSKGTYHERVFTFARVMKAVVYSSVKNGLCQDGGEWKYCHGYLVDVEIWVVSALLSRRLAELANQHDWGVDSANMWVTRPIYFKANDDTDGLQWVRQVKYVFPVTSERLNWASQLFKRTQSLTGSRRNIQGIPHLMYHRPLCVTCGSKTKCFHVLNLKFECRNCINENFTGDNTLIRHSQCKKLFKEATDTLLKNIPCIRICVNTNKQPSRHYMVEHVKQFVTRKRKKSTYSTTYAQAFAEGPTDRIPLNHNDRVPLLNDQIRHKLLLDSPRPTSAALSLTRELKQTEFQYVQLVPRMLISLNTGKKKRGRVCEKAVNKAKMCTRVVGLDGFTVRSRVFESASDRKRFRQQQRRARQRGMKLSMTNACQEF